MLAVGVLVMAIAAPQLGQLPSISPAAPGRVVAPRRRRNDQTSANGRAAPEPEITVASARRTFWSTADATIRTSRWSKCASVPMPASVIDVMLTPLVRLR